MIKSIFSVNIVILAINLSVSLEATCKGKIISDLNQKTCTDKATTETAYYLDRSGCIPKCSIYSTDVQGSCDKDPTVCISGYNCENRCSGSDYQKYSCQTDSDCTTYFARSKCLKFCMPETINEDDGKVPCMAYHSNVPDYINNYWTAKKFKPTCDDDGIWLPKQCKGGLLGRCFCYSSHGIRLFGEALYVDSANMTCACSRKKYELESAGRSFASLHCDSVGNYEKLQCDMEKEICWCTEPLTGELTSPVVPSKAMKKLPCYSEGTVGIQYLRQCESKKFATAMITAKLKAHGVQVVAADTLLCDADGGYGAYSISSGIAYCTWRNNTKIGTWQANLSGLKDKLTCNCARDTYVYGPSLSCDGNGNYEVLQETTDSTGKKKYYCVDADGFSKSDLLDSATTNCSLFY
ncbi:uncharacterized protein LOC126734165 isoform X2 [Anthonomus grandis grandis]|uniref:uncharacterized protein LOC126734165 isoform X2 n=1 Tax=Anthonomus grandis grandis TaxID=2921223 RepID=UPI00216538B5|nr:uncharacterized protein LOC126734165 isoform X2 [Anthonomus grandis grandis]